jgi:hypothetical protein
MPQEVFTLKIKKTLSLLMMMSQHQLLLLRKESSQLVQEHQVKSQVSTAESLQL